MKHRLPGAAVVVLMVLAASACQESPGVFSEPADAGSDGGAGTAAGAEDAPAPEVQEGGAAGPQEADDRGEEGELGVVYRYVVHVFESPSVKSKQIGVLRKGNTLPVERTDKKDEDCENGWLWLPKGNGYACSSHGVKVKKASDGSVKPPIHAPWYDALLPYDYGRIGKDDLPAYNRFPTSEESKQVKTWLAERRALLMAQTEAVKKAMEEGTVVPNPYEPIELQVDNGNGEVSTVSTQDHWTADVEEGPVPTEIPFKFVEKVLLHGFYVSIAHRTYKGGGGWIRTVRGHLVPAGSIRLKSAPSTRGIELNAGEDLPVAFVKRGKATVYTLEDGKFKAAPDKGMARFDAAAVVEMLEVGGAEYLKIGQDHYVKRSDVMLVEKTKPPKIVKSENQKWIDIDVSQQVLVAYEGEKAVYAALVSTGKEKQNIEFKTPRGVFSVLSKHVTGTMDNLYASDGPYMIEDVPWTMYFIGSYALHGAFWHNGFGGMRSHGCINLPPFDARWLFYWADPDLPEGWHSVYSGPERPGTIVKVHD